MKFSLKLFFTILGLKVLILLPLLIVFAIMNYGSIKTEVFANNAAIVDAIAANMDIHFRHKADAVKTITTAPIVAKYLAQSNKKFAQLGAERERYIATLNSKWKKNRELKGNAFINSYLQRELSNYLKQQQKILPGVYGELFITNRYGAMIATTGVLSTLAHKQKYWYQAAYQSGRPFFDDRGYDDSCNGYVVGIVVPMKDAQGKFIGMLKANVNIASFLTTIVSRYEKRKNETKTLEIVRSKGLIISKVGVEPLTTRVSKSVEEMLKANQQEAQIIDNKVIIQRKINFTSGTSEYGFGGKYKSIDHTNGNSGEAWHIVLIEDVKDALAVARNMQNLILLIALILIFTSAIIAYFVGKWIAKPIEEIKNSVEEVAKGNFETEVRKISDDELGELADLLNQMIEELRKQKSDLLSYQEDLEELVAEKTKKIEEQKKVMIVQSRHAAMGEIISMIAHQWRQPLNVIAMATNNILADIALGEFSKEGVEANISQIFTQTQELSKTIDDFKNFFKPSHKLEEVELQKLLDETVRISSSSLKSSKINLVIHNHIEQTIFTYPRELVQLFVIIIDNARDVLASVEKSDKEITIEALSSESEYIITLCDNGLGIDEKILQKIFEPYFSTKSEKNGTGLGLYIAKIIVTEHLRGTIRAYNKKGAACFEVILPYKIKDESV